MVSGGIYSGRFGELRKLFNALRLRGHRVIAPKLEDGVIRLKEVSSFDEIPYGWEDIQAPGKYSVREGGKHFRHGPDAPKRILYPSRLELFRIRPDWSVEYPKERFPPTALFAIKPCDLASISVMDRVQGGVGDPYYLALREKLVIIVENCVEPGATCFCSTMGTGPEARDGFDVAYTRLDDDLVVFRPGSDLGVELLSELSLEPATDEVLRKYYDVLRSASLRARAPFELERLPDELELGLNSPVFKEVAERCFGCAGCNMVCPTCFCFDVIDEPELDGGAVRVRVWDGCFSYTYAEVAGGNFRKDLWARYRHWVLHKFAYWVRQFGVFGCVGCGRCITWCPAGIDLREIIRGVVEWVRSHGGS